MRQDHIDWIVAAVAVGAGLAALFLINFGGAT